MFSEPSWGPSIGNRPLKWTEIGPTNDPWVISDEFETFGDNHFWLRQTRTKILVKKIIRFIKIQNIHSIKIFIFLKSRIFIQTKYSFFLRRAVSNRAMHRPQWWWWWCWWYCLFCLSRITRCTSSITIKHKKVQHRRKKSRHQAQEAQQTEPGQELGWSYNF